MTHIDPQITTDLAADPMPPTVPARVRTAAYFVLLGASAVVLLVTGVLPIWAPDLATPVIATGGVITSVLGTIAGGLGVAYRPTAG